MSSDLTNQIAQKNIQKYKFGPPGVEIALLPVVLYYSTWSEYSELGVLFLLSKSLVLPVVPNREVRVSCL